MNKNTILFTALAGALALLFAGPVLAAGASGGGKTYGDNTWLEGGYTGDNFDGGPDANGLYVRGSMDFTPVISAFAEAGFGSFDSNLTPGNDDHGRYGAGVAYHQPFQYGNWQVSGAWYNEKFGSRTDQYVQGELSAYGQFPNAQKLGWNAGVMYDFQSDIADRNAGLDLGLRYRFAPQWEGVLDTNTFNHDYRMELGVRWHP